MKSIILNKAKITKSVILNKVKVMKNIMLNNTRQLYGNHNVGNITFFVIFNNMHENRPVCKIMLSIKWLGVRIAQLPFFALAEDVSVA